VSNDQNSALEPWLQTLWDQGGSDLLLSAGSPPRIRVDGKLRPIDGAQNLTGEQIDDIAKPLLTDGQRTIFEEQLDVDFAFSWVTRLVYEAASSPLAGRPHWPTSHSHANSQF